MHCFECSEGQHLHSFHASLCRSELPIKSEIICNWAKKSWVGLLNRGRVGDLVASTCLQLLAYKQLLANSYMLEASTCLQLLASRHPAVVEEVLLRSPPPRPG